MGAISRSHATLTCLIFLSSAPPRTVGLTKQELRELPDAVRFAANIENNFIAGGFKTVLNWTSSTLGKDVSAIPSVCTSAKEQDTKLCLKVPMPTPWSASVVPDAPLPDYPRPQLRRADWLNLNGIWQFKSRGVDAMMGSWDDVPKQQIVVPFPVESPLSGIGNHDVNNIDMKYERNFTAPAAWEGKRVLLHFDAVDHTATVFLNGQKLGSHEGGYDRFSFEVTDALREGSNHLEVHAFDPTEFAHIPIGKQRLHPPRKPSSIWYTSSSGIWQTVWLEPVPSDYIERIEIVPDVDAKALHLTVHSNGGAKGLPVRAVVLSLGKKVATAEGTTGKAIDFDIPEPRLWSPDDPFLYDLEISVKDSANGFQGVNGKVHPDLTRPFPGRALESIGDAGDKDSRELIRGKGTSGSTDKVASYFAMRKSSMGRTADGGLRPTLNNEFIFQIGMLDQGFWPDGLYSPASDEALIFDLKFAKELGFNMLRKHTKVESDRWYYHADRLGVLVWQDMPSMFFQSGSESLSLRDKMQFKTELQRIMQQHFNSPSIVTWVIFNEGWGQHDTLEVVKFAQDLDKTRVMDAVSGWVDRPIGDLVDLHMYVGPGSPNPTSTRGAVLGEFGGLGLRVEGHMWIPDDAFAYEMQLTSVQLQDRYVGLVEKIGELMVDSQHFLSAAIYTEVSDVEAEINGWCTYDRMVKKVDPKVLRIANEQLILKSKSLGILGNSTTGGRIRGAASIAKNKKMSKGKKP